MRVRIILRLVLWVPFILFFIFRICFVGRSILDDSALGFVLFTAFHIAICYSYHCAMTPMTLTLALSALTGMVSAEVIDSMFNESSVCVHYAMGIEKFMGVSKENSQPMKLILLNFIGFMLTFGLMYLQILQLQHDELMKQFVFETTGPSIIFTEELTQDIDGYFEELHLDYYEQADLDKISF